MLNSELLRLQQNKTAAVTLNGLSIDVTITDGRSSYGRDQLRVTPVSGSGFAWFVVENVKLTDKKTKNAHTSTRS
jgi:hypothetical protein|tara:strand:+ start:582 stop:806 length:225 start_codon:yes stop_codon:yes gene_type:complete